MSELLTLLKLATDGEIVTRVNALSTVAQAHDQDIAKLQQQVATLSAQIDRMLSFDLYATVPFVLVCAGIFIYAVVTFDRRLTALEKGQ